MIAKHDKLTNALPQAVAPFSAYCDEIETVLGEELFNLSNENVKLVVSNILNGGTSLALHRLVPANIRKQAGIFFTGTELANRVSNQIAPLIQTGVVFVDPACGAGDLLLACAKHLPIGRDLTETLNIWSQSIAGCDLYPEFIKAAKLRIMLLAFTIHGCPTEFGNLSSHANIFTNLRVGDVFGQTLLLHEAECVVVNPPFIHVNAPKDCKWATGSVQSAALFLDSLLNTAPDGQHIVAILPDVLRSGTRYKKWRETISHRSRSLQIELVGRFDSTTDVDVFILHIIADRSGNTETEWPALVSDNYHTTSMLSDLFDVRTGTVVPHRDPINGPSYPFAHSRIITPWQTITNIKEKRCYDGTVFSPPFVLVRRTSSPTDKNRCVAALINEKRQVAVENHLIVIKPKNGGYALCEKLMGKLRDEKTNQWLNERIRCRHLTVSAIKELPWWDSE